ncbi:MAG: hypothetical protein ABIW84_02065 [Ilumatobacteraceae bacterium]
MASYNKFQQFVEDLAKGVHNFTSDATSTVTVALTAAANAPVATNAVLGDLTQIAYTNLSSRVIINVTAEHTTGTVTFAGDDLVLTASGAVATFRYVVLYNDDPTSPADPLIAWYDYGSNVTLASGETFTIDFTGGWATLG